MQREGYKEGRLLTASHTLAACPQTAEQNMAPCKLRMQHDQHSAGNHMRKLRKPVIEKMRRDRINSSIEKLRVLLEKEFQKQQLPSKPEKADILEMTVSLLQQHLAGKYKSVPSQAHREGYSQCLQESEHYLTAHTQTHWNLLRHFHSQQSTPQEDIHTAATTSDSWPGQTAQGSSKALWRPW